MQLHLTDGQSRFTSTISEDLDHEAAKRIRESQRPVTTAVQYIKKRIRPDGARLWPVPGLALEGL